MTESRKSILESVTTPLGFFVLVVLVVEVIFGIAAHYFDQQRTLIIIPMIVLIFVLVGIVTFLSCCRPYALKGGYDPELKKMMESFRAVESLASKLSGDWKFSTSCKLEENSHPVLVTGHCTISKGKYGISMRGNAIAPEGDQETPFVVKQTFLSDEGLTYIYEVPQKLGQMILGVGQVQFNNSENKSVIREMAGNWAVLGSNTSGEVKFNR